MSFASPELEALQLEDFSFVSLLWLKIGVLTYLYHFCFFRITSIDFSSLQRRCVSSSRSPPLFRLRAHSFLIFRRHGPPNLQIRSSRAHPSVSRRQRTPSSPALFKLALPLFVKSLTSSLSLPRISLQNMQDSEDVHIRLIISRGVKNTPHQNPLSTVGVSSIRFLSTRPAFPFVLLRPVFLQD